jgi:hypothetical protein
VRAWTGLDLLCSATIVAKNIGNEIDGQLFSFNVQALKCGKDWREKNGTIRSPISNPATASLALAASAVVSALWDRAQGRIIHLMSPSDFGSV